MSFVVKLIFFLSIFILNFLSVSNAQQVIILNEETTGELGRFAGVLEDKTGLLELDEVKGSSLFSQFNREVLAFPPNNSTIWIKLEVINKTGKDYFLFINNPYIYDMQLFSYLGDSLHSKKYLGNKYPFREREFQSTDHITSLDLPKDSLVTIYINYKGAEGLEMPFQITTFKGIFQNNYFKNLLNGLYYGILLVSMLFNFFLYITIKDKSYLYYVLYILTFGIIQTSIHGYSYQYFWPESAWLAKYSINIFSAVTGIFVINFVRHFLQIHLKNTIFNTIGYVIQGVCGFTLLLVTIAFFTDDTLFFWIDIFASFSSFTIPFYMLTLATKYYLQGYRPARFFLIAWVIFLFGVIVYILKTNAILPYNFFTTNMMQIGSALETILLTLALGDRYNMLKKEKEETQRQMIIALKENQRLKDKLNKELEQIVRERTKTQNELTESNRDLLKINTDLDNFVYTASHDLKAPVVNIEGLINTIKVHNSYQDAHVKRIVDLMDVSIKKFKSTINDLSEITKIQKNASEEIESNSLSEVFEEVRFSIRHMLESSKAIIQTNFSECESINFPRKNFRSILYNLLSNAIKYRSNERQAEIFIKTYKTQDYLVLQVRDNGIGIQKENLHKIFGMFKRAHDHVEGSGIGLYIVKRIIENEGGFIEVSSEQNIGTTFTVYFKISDHLQLKETFESNLNSSMILD